MIGPKDAEYLPVEGTLSPLPQDFIYKDIPPNIQYEYQQLKYSNGTLISPTEINPQFDPYKEYEYEPELLQPFAKWLHCWFCNDKNTPMAQVILAFAFGVLLSPWSSGLFFLTIFIIINEILFYVFTKGDPRYYNVFVRTGVIYASILGFILGRTLSGDEILYEGIWPCDK